MRKALYMMGVLGETDIEWMIQNGARQYLPAGTVLITKGTPIDALYIVLEGELAVHLRVNDKPLASLLAGEIVGEISLVDARPPSASVSAVLNSHVLRLPRNKLMRRLDDDPGFGARFYRAVALYLADRLRTTSSRLGYGDAGPDQDPSEMDEPLMDNAVVGGARFDRLLRQLRTEERLSDPGTT